MKYYKYLIVVLFLVLSLIIIGIIQSPDKNFHIVACSVGEGDATLLVYKNIQILVDGGPDSKVLDCLGKYLPFWDRTLELVISTHPDRDHFAGLIDVFKRYKVDNYLVNPIKVSKPEYGVLEKEVGSRGPRVFYPHDGQTIRVGLIYLDTLAPMGQLITNSEELKTGEAVPDNKTNAYSIVSLVSFGNFRALLTGDMTPETSDALSANRQVGSVNYIKTPHHGSRNGLTENLLKILRPAVATISVGKNTYGHPAPEIINLLKKYNVKTLRTDEVGNIEAVSDGRGWWVEQKN